MLTRPLGSAGSISMKLVNDIFCCCWKAAHTVCDGSTPGFRCLVHRYGRRNRESNLLFIYSQHLSCISVVALANKSQVEQLGSRHQVQPKKECCLGKRASEKENCTMKSRPWVKVYIHRYLIWLHVYILQCFPYCIECIRHRTHHSP